MNGKSNIAQFWFSKSFFKIFKAGVYLINLNIELKSVHFKKPVTRSSFLSKSVVIFVVVILKMTTVFERNEDRVTGFF